MFLGLPLLLLCAPNVFFCILPLKIGEVTSCYSEAIKVVLDLAVSFVGIKVGTAVLKYMLILD